MPPSGRAQHSGEHSVAILAQAALSISTRIFLVALMSRWGKKPVTTDALWHIASGPSLGDVAKAAQSLVESRLCEPVNGLQAASTAVAKLKIDGSLTNSRNSATKMLRMLASAAALQRHFT